MGKAVAISTYDVDKIFKICGTCIGKPDKNGVAREMLQWIKIEIRNENFIAYGCDSVRIAMVSGKTIGTDTEKEFDLYVKPVRIAKKTQYVTFVLNDDKSTEIIDGESKTVFEPPLVENFIDYKSVWNNQKAKQPLKVCINAAQFAEILNQIKGGRKADNRVLLTFDIDNTEKPILIQPLKDENQEFILCTLRNPQK